MGVHNTENRRVTVYLKQAHLDFLDDVIASLKSEQSIAPSRSDLIRAILDNYTGTKDWRSLALLDTISAKGQ